MMRAEALGAASFFEKILGELYQSVYLALGGSLEEGMDWASRGWHFLGIGIKILILLVIIGFFYWVCVYLIKHARTLFRLSDRHIRIARSTLRYFWLVASILAIMTQVGAKGDTIKAVAKAASWAGFYYVLWAMSGQLVRGLLRHYDINASIEQLFHNMVVVLIVVLALATVMAQFGFDIVSIVAGLGIAGVAVGFAAQSTLANFIAGIAILVEQSFQVGDWVRIGTQEGRVVKIALRTTHILDRDNIIVIFPNSTVASSEVVNLTSKTFVRFDVPVRVALDADIDEARSSILAVLKNDSAVLPHPLSTVTIDRVGEYGVFLIVRFWVAPSAVARLPIVKEHIIESIKKVLDEQGMTAPYPHMQLIYDKETGLEKILTSVQEAPSFEATSSETASVENASLETARPESTPPKEAHKAPPKIPPAHTFPDGS